VGIAVLASVFARHGAVTSSAGFLAGIGPALWWGAALAAAGLPVALALPGRSRVHRPSDDRPTEVVGAH
jgi:hypothetical protein